MNCLRLDSTLPGKSLYSLNEKILTGLDICFHLLIDITCRL